MINLAAFLAAVEIDEEYLKQRAAESGLQGLTHESIFLFGVLLAVTIALFIWAYFLRRKRHHRRAKRKHSSLLSQNDAENVLTLFQGRRRRTRHRRRREHRPRNPTLAETGGLPPIRPEDQPPPPV